MDKKSYKLIESYMLKCMHDSAHDKEHIYRVLNTALEIAEKEGGVNYDILIASCLLHDIGRKEQYENPSLCHAEVGSRKAYAFLKSNGFDEGFCSQVAYCISCHRFRGNNSPETTEAKILFDADKLDATGTLGIARTLFYNSQHGEPLYSVDENGLVLDGTDDKVPSFFQEYKYKLEKLYSRFLTDTGRQLAEERKKSAVSFYESMLSEVQSSYKNGRRILAQTIED